jgi:hypothetical protein
VGLALLVGVNIIFLVDIELTLSRNKHIQVAGDNLWGFGQVLALLLLVVPLRDAWNALRDVQAALRGVQQQLQLRFQQLLREEAAATAIAERLRVLITRGADPRKIEENEIGDLLQLAYNGRKDIVVFLLSEEWPANNRVIETKSSKIGSFCCTYHP